MWYIWMPLATKVKKARMKIVHLAGATKLLFDIKRKRWENYSSKIAICSSEKCV